MLLTDLRHALRMPAKSPGFTVVAVLSLALGIGANTAIFSLLDQVMLRLLPVSHPEQLVILRSPGPHHGHTWSDVDEGAQSFSFPMYKALREGNGVFSGLIACYPTEASIGYHNQTESVDGELVSGNFFDVLGVTPALGRMFSLDDDRVQGAHPVVVLSYSYWQRRFGGDPSILNQAVLVNAQPMTVVGVARRGFTGAQASEMPDDVFLPLMMKPVITPGWNALDDWNDYWLPVLGRLKPGVTIQGAEAGLEGLYHGLLEQQASAQSHWEGGERARFIGRKLLLIPGGRGRAVLAHDTGTPVVALFVMVGLVLLMVCTNLANLLLARGAARQRELAVRLALGASRGRLISQLLTESLVCALAGGIVGLPVAAWTLRTLVSRIIAGAGIQGLSPQLDLRVLIFAFGLTLLAGVIFGLAPAFRATRADVNSTLKNQSGASVAPAQVRLRKAMVTAQVAFTVLLLVGAGLFTRTLWNLRHMDLGMRPDHLISFGIAPALNGYTSDQTRILCDRLREALAVLPGVQSASGAEIAALTDTDASANITVPGAPPLRGDLNDVRTDHVAPGYFSTLGIPLITGREFTASEGPQSPKVAIVNEAMVRRFIPSGDALGRRFAFGSGDVKPDIEIVGVVQDARNSQIRGDKISPYVYMPYEQDPKLGQMTFYVRTFQDPLALAPELRKTVQHFDANLPVPNVKTMEATIDEDIFAERLVAQLSLGFGVLAALLAAIGIYGVLAYTVVQRTREIGIRVAVGARPGEVQRLVYREVGPMLAVGLAIGLPATYALSRLVESLLYGIRAGDLPVYAGALILVAAAAGLASFIPARRATKVDPMVALRYE